MKYDSYSLKRAQRPTKVFEFRDPLNPSFTPDIELRRFGLMSAAAIDERAQEMYRKHVTGSGPTDSEGNLNTEAPSYVPPRLVGFVDGEPVSMTYATCRAVAAVELAQTQPDDTQRYTFQEIALWCASDHLGMQILMAANWVAPEEPKRDEVPNSAGGSTPPQQKSVSEDSSSTQE